MGWHPRPPITYSEGYFKEYQRRDNTPLGEALTKARIEMVLRHHKGEVVDVGIGGGRFVHEMNARGYDISKDACNWLIAQGRYSEPAGEALTFWDSLEHIPDPAAAVALARKWVFVSMPIYESADGVIVSKHYKPGEHLWYWTQPGLIEWFDEQGFSCVEINDMETKAGRDEIYSFAFMRKRNDKKE